MENNENQPEASEGTQPATEATTPQEAPATEPAPQPEAPAAAFEPQAAPSAPQSTDKAKPPKAVIGMIFGIASIVFCYMGAVSFVLGLLAVIWHGKAKAVYLTDEPKYKGGYTLSKVGNITGWIGMPLSFIYIIIWVIYVIEVS